MAFFYRLLSSTWLLHAVLLGGVLLWLKAGAVLPQGLDGTLAEHNGWVVLLIGALIAVLALLYQSANTALQVAVLVVGYCWAQSMDSLAAVAVISILIPVNLLVLALLEERGLFGPPGLARLGVLLLQGLIVVAVDGQYPEILERLAAMHLLPRLLDVWVEIPHQGLLLTLMAAATLMVLSYYERVPAIIGTLSALLIAAAGLDAMAAEPQSSRAAALFSTALLALLLATLQEVHRLAFRDGLTNLPNRRAMDAMLQRLGNRYAIAMMDVDHFKKFNDTYGHEVGDQVLRRVANIIGRVGEGGRPFRYGGEEFAIIFPGRNAKGVFEELDELREEVAETPFMVRDPDRPDDPEEGERQRSKGKEKGKGKQVQITISIGVADSSGAHAEPSEVVQTADQALYRAKEGGRNRVSR